MKRWIPAALLCTLIACGGGATPTQPTPVTPTPTTFSLSGTVTSSKDGSAISGATAKIADGPNAGKTATTDGNGNYSMAGLTQSGFTVNFTAPFFTGTSQAVTLTSNQVVSASLAPIPIFTASGIGDNVFTLPSTVTRVRVDATYPGSCQNFIVHLGSSGLINIIIGTCSVADTRSPFSGTYAVSGGSTISIVSSTGVSWTFTELR